MHYASAVVTSLFLVVTVLVGSVGRLEAGHHGTHIIVRPGKTPVRVGPSYLYPDPTINPGVPNRDITQANISSTICNPSWSTSSIRPSPTYTNRLKIEQLASRRYRDKEPSHYEEDHIISLELGGHPTDPRNLWPEMWGTPAHPPYCARAISAGDRRSQGQGSCGKRAPIGKCAQAR
jgi:hypothetical protein